MSIFYLDYENGNDASDGSDWANAWKTLTTGATAARIAPGDTIRIAKSSDPVNTGVNGTWTKTSVPFATAKTISSSTNASPISVACTDHGYVTGDCVVIYSHITNTTANGIWIITRTDDNNFTLDGSVGIGVGSGGTSVLLNRACVKLSAALTKTITRCNQTWTAVNGSTITLETSTSYTKDGNSMKLVKSSPNNDTLYGYFTLSDSGIDFSNYQKISFWIRTGTAIDSASALKICLCSDTAGASIIDTFYIPVIPSTNILIPITIAKNGGGNLGSAIKSIAVYTATISGATVSIYVDNVIACTTNGLNLTSLISKNSLAQGGTEAWYPIHSISEDGKIIRIDNNPNTVVYQGVTTGGIGYSGETETLALYKRETIKTTMATNSSVVIQEIMDSGTIGNLINFFGGFNTSTSIQDGETFFDGSNGYGYGIKINQNYILINKINTCRYYNGILSSSAQGNNISSFCNIGCGNYGVFFQNITDGIVNFDFINNTYNGIYFNGICTNTTLTIGEIINFMNGGFLDGASSTNLIISSINKVSNGGSSHAIYLQSAINLVVGSIGEISYCANRAIYLYFGSNIQIGPITTIDYTAAIAAYYVGRLRIDSIGEIKNTNNAAVVSLLYLANCTDVEIEDCHCLDAENTQTAISISGSTVKMKNLVVSGTGLAGIQMDGKAGGNLILNNALIQHSTECIFSGTGGDVYIYSHKHDQTANNHWIFTDNGTINSDITNRHTASGICWKLSPTGVIRDIDYPLWLKIAKVACTADNLVTIKAWIKKSHATDIGAKLVCKGGQLSGVPNDVTATKSDDTNYEELTITFTPTEAGVVEIEAWAYWIANAADESVYVDDMTVSQT